MTIEFFDYPDVWAWCREHDYALIEGEALDSPRLADAPGLGHRELLVHTVAGDAAAASALAARVAAALGPWDECLAWATAWDVWLYEEDWPRFYAWRVRYGERRSLGAAPGHRFDAVDGASFAEFLAHALECGWDVTLLPAASGRPTGRRIRTSHDEWVELRAASPVESGLQAG